MDKNYLTKSDDLDNYIAEQSLRELPVLKALRQETQKDPAAIMQIPAVQGQFMDFLCDNKTSIGNT